MKLKFYAFIALMCLLVQKAYLQSNYSIRINQVGYFKGEKKLGSIVSAATFGGFDYTIENKTSGKITLSGKVENPAIWTPSKEYVFTIDFSTLDEEGTYTIVTPNAKKDIVISKNTYSDIAKASLKYYYFNRATMALEEKYAGVWKRPLGHPDNNVLIHTSAATAKRPAGTKISSPKGWYDAGDYNKYIVNSGISTYTLLSAYEHYPSYYDKLALSIPEEGGSLPDLLDEVLWNLDWMLTMQDPDDGGVYHKCTDKTFTGEVMPHASNPQRYVVQKTTAATLNFAAVMAVASRVYAKFENVRPGFSKQLVDAAEKAYVWAKANPAIYYKQPSDIQTGEYGDGNVKDEFEWATAELLITTKDVKYKNNFNLYTIGGGVAAWPYVSPLASISLSHHKASLKDIVDASVVDPKITSMANALKNAVKNSSMKVAMGESNGDFVWGSNGQASNQIIVLIRAYDITKDITFLDAAYQGMDYLLGRNGTGYCYVTGYGTLSTMNPHHRPSKADGILKPVPGMVAGGPNPGQQDKCAGYPNKNPASSYVDTWCSYASNEVAINWNAPLAYALNALEFYHEQKLSVGINDNIPGLTNIKLFPNPSFDSITIEGLGDEKYNYIIYDRDGKLVSKGVTANNEKVDITSLSTGSYLIYLTSKTIIETIGFSKH